MRVLIRVNLTCIIHDYIIIIFKLILFNFQAINVCVIAYIVGSIESRKEYNSRRIYH